MEYVCKTNAKNYSDRLLPDVFNVVLKVGPIFAGKWWKVDRRILTSNLARVQVDLRIVTLDLKSVHVDQHT